MILMQSGESTIERALYLARSGQAKTVDEIRRKLKVEGYGNVDAHLSGGTLKNQLRASILNADRLPAEG